jgi:hypothetical protein
MSISIASKTMKRATGLKKPEFIRAATATLTSDMMYGGVINTYGQTDNIILTLPAPQAGMSVTVIVGTTVAKYVRVTAAATDKIYLDGTAGSDNGYVGIASVTAGEAIECFAFQTGAGTYDWFVKTLSGTWVAG